MADPDTSNDVPDADTEGETGKEGKNDDENAEQQTCGKNDVKPIPYNEITTGDRLTVHRNGYIDLLNTITKKPRGSIPETFLPEWTNMPMDKKLPEVPAPAGAFIWSRGRLCEPLHRNLKQFYNDDPHNRKKVVTGPYNALHDPGTENYFQTPLVKNLIFGQGLINAEEKVLCSAGEFNQYRRYLCHSKYAEDLNASQVYREKIISYEQNQVLELRKEISKTEGKQFKADQKRLKAKQQQDLAQQIREKKFEKRRKDEEYQEMIHRRQVEEANERRKFEGLIRDGQRDAKINSLKLRRLEEKACLVKRILQKDRNSEQYIEETRRMKEHAKQEFLLIWLQQKWKAQEQKIKRDKIIDESIRQEVHRNAEKRQKKVNAYREHLPEILVKRKAEEARIWAIVKKFFYRWLENVRKRKARRPDAMHKSLWDIPTVFDETVTYLRKESGYEKFDDFILSIVKLKQNIRDELEKEEAAEREAASQMTSRHSGVGETV